MKLESLLATFDGYGSLTEDQQARIGFLKEAFKACASVVYSNCPDSAETEKVLYLLHDAMTLAHGAVQSEPNVFFSSNLTDRAEFIKKNPDTWTFYMRAAGLSTPHDVK